MSEAEVARIAIGAALDDAGLTWDDVDGVCLYDIESTTVGDLAEVLGLRHVRFFSTHSHGGGAYCAVMLPGGAAPADGRGSGGPPFRGGHRRQGCQVGLRRDAG